MEGSEATCAWSRGAASRIPETAQGRTLDAAPDPLTHDVELAARYLWDPLPVLDRNGDLADVHGQQWWLVLTADRTMHPEARHDHARLRLVHRDAAGWHDLGNLFPDGASPGSREWSGTALFDEATSELRVLYTAAGSRGETHPSFVQRLFAATAKVLAGRIAGWGDHHELVAAAPPYLPADETHAAPGLCRAFRDPFYFQDPADGSEHLLFAASLGDPEQPHAGAVGLATRRGDSWVLRQPLFQAAGVNRELERPHLLAQDGRYYLFFSTHGQSFHTDTPGPTGLYGFVAETLEGPFDPLNDSGLVLSNPGPAPYRAYAWQVLSDGHVVSFCNYPHAGPGPLSEEAVFAGTISPLVRLHLDGTRTQWRHSSSGVGPHD